MRTGKHALLSLTLLIAALAQFSCGLRPDRVTFQAKVADLRKPGNSFARNKRPDDLVEIALPGRMLEVPAVVKLVGRREADWSTPESAAASILSANWRELRRQGGGREGRGLSGWARPSMSWIPSA